MKSLAKKACWVLAVLIMGLALLACSRARNGNLLADGPKVPEDITKDFLSHPHFSAFKTEPTGLKWLIYEERDSLRIVGATFKARGESGQQSDFYYFATYGPEKAAGSPDKIHTTFASIDDPDFDVSGFGVSEKKTPDGASQLRLIATGLASDPRVTRVALETSEGRTLEATMYGRFWAVDSEAASAGEKVTRTWAYAQEGTILYQHPPFVASKGSTPIRGPGDVPDEIVKDFYSDIPAPTDVQWQVCVREGDRTIVGVTYKLPNRYGEIIDMYYVMVYGPHAKRLWGTRNGILSNSLDAGGAYIVANRDDWNKMLIRMGYCPDDRMVKVACETSAGRVIDAKTYGRFYVLLVDKNEGERLTRAVALDADGIELYELTFDR